MPSSFAAIRRALWDLKLLAASLVVLGFYLYQLWLVAGLGRDIYWGDEWFLLSGLRASHGEFSLGWLVRPHNEHRLVTSKLVVWLLFQLNHWNAVWYVFLNYLLFGLVLVTAYLVFHKANPRLQPWLLMLSLVFLNSPFVWENHVMGMQMQIHLTIIFSLLSAVVMFSKSQRWSSLFVGIVLLLFAAYSHVSGIASVAAIVPLYALFKARRIQQLETIVSPRKDFFQGLLAVLLGALIVVLWLNGYNRPSYSPAPVSLFDLRFWQFFVNLTSLGFGFEKFSSSLGLIILILVLLPCLFVMLQRKIEADANVWLLLAVTGVAFSWLACISIGRASFPDIEIFSKASRYAEFSALLVPLALLWWSSVVFYRPIGRAAVLAGVLILSLLRWRHNWDYSIYDYISNQKSEEISCAHQYLSGNTHIACLDKFSKDKPEYWKQAADLDVSFVRSSG